MSATPAKRNRYDDNEVTVALELLVVHGMNYAKTSEITGVKETTLRSWANRTHQDTLAKIQADPAVVARIRQSHAAQAEELGNRYFQAQHVFVDKALELAPTMKQADNAMKAAHNAALAAKENFHMASLVRGEPTGRLEIQQDVPALIGRIAHSLGIAIDSTAEEIPSAAQLVEGAETRS